MRDLDRAAPEKGLKRWPTWSALLQSLAWCALIAPVQVLLIPAGVAVSYAERVAGFWLSVNCLVVILTVALVNTRYAENRMAEKFIYLALYGTLLFYIALTTTAVINRYAHPDGQPLSTHLMTYWMFGILLLIPFLALMAAMLWASNHFSGALARKRVLLFGV